MLTKRPTALLLIWLAAFVAACGDNPPRPSSAGGPSPRGVTIDWENPIPLAQPVSSMDEARPYLAFSPREPQGLGRPVRILMTKPLAGQESGRVLAFLFDTAEYGRVIVIQELSQLTLQQYDDENQKLAAGNDRPGRVGSAEVTPIRGGLQALVTTSSDGAHSDIRWREGPVQLLIEGPNLDRSACITIANGV